MRPNPDGKRLPSTGFDGENMYMNENSPEFLPPNQVSGVEISLGGGGGGGGPGSTSFYAVVQGVRSELMDDQKSQYSS
uniref:Uncharacterized protein n=1 Tax=Knipowitschia caucasica TaxID=637954 RepID=A0AAV2M8F6_KNICA